MVDKGEILSILGRYFRCLTMYFGEDKKTDGAYHSND